MKVELPNGKVIDGVPDGTSKLEIAQIAVKNGLATKEDFGGFVPEQWGQDQAEQYDIGGEITDTPGQHIAENTAHMVTGAVAEPVANIVGGIHAITNPLIQQLQGKYANPMAGPNARDTVRDALTYQPKGAVSQEVLNKNREILQKYVGRHIESARLGDEALEAGLPEPVARVAEAIPDMAFAGLTSLGMPRAPKMKVDAAGNPVSPMGKKAIAGQDLRNHPGNPSTAPYKLDAKGAVIKDPAGKSAIQQGWSDKLVAGVKGANEATKLKIKKMAQLARDRGEGGDIKTTITTRPSDIPGNSLASRYRFVKGANSASGKLLGKIAKDQGAKGVTVDVSRAAKWLDDQFKQNGIEITPDGKVNFSQSGLPKSDHGLIRENIQQIKRVMGDNPSGLNFAAAHELKQILRRTGLSYKQTIAKTGASDTTQGLFKGFSSKIDEVLDNTSTAYDKQNIKFGDTRNVLDAIEKIGKDNLFTESVDSQLGLFARRLTGNPVSRGAIMDMVKHIDDVAAKYGGKFDDDLFTQIQAVNEMDKVLGVAADTSFLGDSAAAQTIATGANSSMTVNAAKALEAGAKWVARKSEAKAITSLEALTR